MSDKTFHLWFYQSISHESPLTLSESKLLKGESERTRDKYHVPWLIDLLAVGLFWAIRIISSTSLTIILRAYYIIFSTFGGLSKRQSRIRDMSLKVMLSSKCSYEFVFIIFTFLDLEQLSQKKSDFLLERLRQHLKTYPNRDIQNAKANIDRRTDKTLSR